MQSATLAALLAGLLLVQASAVDAQARPSASRAVSGKAVDDERWRDALAFIRHQPSAAHPGLVNLFINSMTYGSDRESGGAADEWIAPAEFMRRGVGDCEDFAFAKYQALRELGLPGSQLRLVFAYTPAETDGPGSAVALTAPGHRREARGAHMVLVVLERDDADVGDGLVLDNVSDNVLSLRERLDLQPVFAFNTASQWSLNPDRLPLPTRLLDMRKRLLAAVRNMLD